MPASSFFYNKPIIHSVILMRKSRDELLTIVWQAAAMVRLPQPIANSSATNFRVRKTLCIISFDIELTVNLVLSTLQKYRAA